MFVGCATIVEQPAPFSKRAVLDNCARETLVQRDPFCARIVCRIGMFSDTNAPEQHTCDKMPFAREPYDGLTCFRHYLVLA